MPIRLRRATHIALLGALVLPPIARAQDPSLRIPPGAQLVRGLPSGIEIAGLSPHDTATLDAWRRVIVRGPGDHTDTLTLRASGTFAAVTSGNVHIDSTIPIRGTWSRVDPYALLWSMQKTDTAITLLPGRIFLRLSSRGHTVDSATLTMRTAPTGIAGRWVQGDGFAGAFAAPASSGMHPAIILLHGSEGGDTTTARALAESFAAQGYAAFALTYFAFGGRIPGIPTALVNIPVGMVDQVRNWMGAQPAVDTSRTALWGGSKGGEFALLIASRRTWPRAVVACVPSDVVWTGFGRTPGLGERLSSWSDSGSALPFIPYDRYDDALSDRVTARIVHDRSRALFADSVYAAIIHLERSRARILMLGSDRDEVWPSGSMVRALADTMRAHGKAEQAEAHTYPMAGHGICGTGSSMSFQFERTHATDAPPDAAATAAAAADAWRRTVDFLRSALR
ncbi:MAG: esterase [Gemmatimonadetes bacterium]|nr:esterase [Gemmatimonadota bacterium]